MLNPGLAAAAGMLEPKAVQAARRKAARLSQAAATGLSPGNPLLTGAGEARRAPQPRDEVDEFLKAARARPSGRPAPGVQGPGIDDPVGQWLVRKKPSREDTVGRVLERVRGDAARRLRPDEDGLLESALFVRSRNRDTGLEVSPIEPMADVSRLRVSREDQIDVLKKLRTPEGRASLEAEVTAFRAQRSRMSAEASVRRGRGLPTFPSEGTLAPASPPTERQASFGRRARIGDAFSPKPGSPGLVSSAASADRSVWEDIASELEYQVNEGLMRSNPVAVGVASPVIGAAQRAQLGFDALAALPPDEFGEELPTLGALGRDLPGAVLGAPVRATADLAFAGDETKPVRDRWMAAAQFLLNVGVLDAGDVANLAIKGARGAEARRMAKALVEGIEQPPPSAAVKPAGKPDGPGIPEDIRVRAKQYRLAKRSFPDEVLGVRSADGYEMFGQDVWSAYKVLKRGKFFGVDNGDQGWIVGLRLPKSSVDRSVAKLEEAGYRVKLLDRDPDQGWIGGLRQPPKGTRGLKPVVPSGLGRRGDRLRPSRPDEARNIEGALLDPPARVNDGGSGGARARAVEPDAATVIDDGVTGDRRVDDETVGLERDAADSGEGVGAGVDQAGGVAEPVVRAKGRLREEVGGAVAGDTRRPGRKPAGGGQPGAGAGQPGRLGQGPTPVNVEGATGPGELRFKRGASVDVATNDGGRLKATYSRAVAIPGAPDGMVLAILKRDGLSRPYSVTDLTTGLSIGEGSTVKSAIELAETRVGADPKMAAELYARARASGRLRPVTAWQEGGTVGPEAGPSPREATDGREADTGAPSGVGPAPERARGARVDTGRARAVRGGSDGPPEAASSSPAREGRSGAGLTEAQARDALENLERRLKAAAGPATQQPGVVRKLKSERDGLKSRLAEIAAERARATGLDVKKASERPGGDGTSDPSGPKVGDASARPRFDYERLQAPGDARLPNYGASSWEGLLTYKVAKSDKKAQSAFASEGYWIARDPGGSYVHYTRGEPSKIDDVTKALQAASRYLIEPHPLGVRLTLYSERGPIHTSVRAITTNSGLNRAIKGLRERGIAEVDSSMRRFGAVGADAPTVGEREGLDKQAGELVGTPGGAAVPVIEGGTEAPPATVPDVEAGPGRSGRGGLDSGLGQLGAEGEGLPIEARPEDIPIDRLAIQFANQTFRPEAKALRVQQWYVDLFNANRDDWLKRATSAEQREIVIAELPRFREGLLTRVLKWADAEGRWASPMITGPAKFPVERNKRAIQSADNRLKEVADYIESVEKSVARRAGFRGTAIMSDDPNAIERLNGEILVKQGVIGYYSEINSIARDRTATEQEKLARIIATPVPENAQLWAYDAAQKGRISKFPQFAFSNVQAQIRRLRTRIESISARVERPAFSASFDGGRVVEDKEAVRVRIFYDVKPDFSTTERLKSRGFKWSPKANAWQRLTTNNAWKAAMEVTGAKRDVPDVAPGGGVWIDAPGRGEGEGLATRTGEPTADVGAESALALAPDVEAGSGRPGRVGAFFAIESADDLERSLRLAFSELPKAQDGAAAAGAALARAWAEQQGLRRGVTADQVVRETFAGVARGDETLVDAYQRGLKGAGAPRGAVEMLEDGRAIIHALDKPDASTLPHELAHVFFKYLDENESGVVRATFERSNRAVGGSIDEFFATSFERYLKDGGSAPNSGLTAVFERFKSWLAAIYKTLIEQQSLPRLNNELRGVFDGLLADVRGYKTVPPRVDPVSLEFRIGPNGAVDTLYGGQLFRLPDDAVSDLNVNLRAYKVERDRVEGELAGASAGVAGRLRDRLDALDRSWEADKADFFAEYDSARSGPRDTGTAPLFQGPKGDGDLGPYPEERRGRDRLQAQALRQKRGERPGGAPKEQGPPDPRRFDAVEASIRDMRRQMRKRPGVWRDAAGAVKDFTERVTVAIGGNTLDRLRNAGEAGTSERAAGQRIAEDLERIGNVATTETARSGFAITDVWRAELGPFWRVSPKAKATLRKMALKALDGAFDEFTAQEKRLWAPWVKENAKLVRLGQSLGVFVDTYIGRKTDHLLGEMIWYYDPVEGRETFGRVIASETFRLGVRPKGREKGGLTWLDPGTRISRRQMVEPEAFIPHRVLPEVIDHVRRGEGPWNDRIVDEVMRREGISDRGAARKFVERLFEPSEKGTDAIGRPVRLEAERVPFALPLEAYDTDLWGLIQGHLSSSWTRLQQARVWGHRGETLAYWAEQLGHREKAVMDLVGRSLHERIGDTVADRAVRTVVGWEGAWQLLSKLTGLGTTVIQATSVGNTVGILGARNSAKAAQSLLKSLVTDRAGLKRLRNSGVGNQLLSMMNIDDYNEWARQLSDWGATLSGIRPIDTSLRYHAALTGKLAVEEAVRRLKVVGQGGRVKRPHADAPQPTQGVVTAVKKDAAYRLLRDWFLFSEDDVLRLAETRQLRSEDEVRAYHGGARTQGRNRMTDVPPIFNAFPAMRLFWRFQSFAYQQTKLLGWSMKEAAKGNPLPLSRLGASFLALGLVVGEARERLQDAMAGKRTVSDLDSFEERVFTRFLRSGFFGLLERPMVSYARYVDATNDDAENASGAGGAIAKGVADLVSVPLASDVVNAFGALGFAQKSGGGAGAALDEWARNSVVLYGRLRQRGEPDFRYVREARKDAREDLRKLGLSESDVRWYLDTWLPSPPERGTTREYQEWWEAYRSIVRAGMSPDEAREALGARPPQWANQPKARRETLPSGTVEGILGIPPRELARAAR